MSREPGEEGWPRSCPPTRRSGGSSRARRCLVVDVISAVPASASQIGCHSHPDRLLEAVISERLVGENISLIRYGLEHKGDCRIRCDWIACAVRDCQNRKCD